MQHDRSAPLGFPYEIRKTDDPRHVDRNSHYFKSSYSLRTECERYNSRFKNTGQERIWVRNKSSVTNLNTLAKSVCWQLQWLPPLHAPDNLTAS